MDLLYLDFLNKVSGIDNSSQSEIEINMELDKKMIAAEIEPDILKHDCITLDFETEKIMINKDIFLNAHDIDIDAFEPVQILPVAGLADRKKKILEDLHYVSMKEVVLRLLDLLEQQNREYGSMHEKRPRAEKDS